MATHHDTGPVPPTPPTGQGGETSPAKGRGCGGRCCLWGCGGLTVVAAVLAAGLVLLYLTFGKPWIDARKTEILAKFPALNLALETASIRNLPEPLREGSTAREDFPGDIFIPESLISAAFRTSEAGAVARLRLDARTDLGALAASYRREMGRLGWTRQPTPDPRDGICLRFSRSDRNVRVLLRRDPDAVTVWIHSRPDE